MLKEKAQLFYLNSIYYIVNVLKDFSRWQKIVMFLVLLLIIPSYYAFRYLGKINESKRLEGIKFFAKISSTKALSLNILRKAVIKKERKNIFYVLVKNPNPSRSLKNAEYVFNVKGVEYTGKFDIPAGKSTYLMMEGEGDAFTFSYKSGAWVKNTLNYKLSSTASKTYYDPDLQKLVYESGVFNGEDVALQNVRVLAILKDRQSKIVDMQEIYIDQISPYQTEKLRLLWSNTDPLLETEVLY